MIQHDESMSRKAIQTMPSRRGFLKLAGGLTGMALVAGPLTGCGEDEYSSAPDNRVNLGSGDPGVLNYAYALEQLEAAFYARVIESPYAGMTANELALLTDIRDHEYTHREFFKAAITAARATPIRNLEVDFSLINFNDRTSVLTAARTFEDLGVAAYNGAGRLIQTPDYLLIAGKIVSVEARHAALIRDLISNGSFADTTVVDANGLDAAKMPAEVLAAAAAFLKTRLNGDNLPTS